MKASIRRVEWVVSHHWINEIITQSYVAKFSSSASIQMIDGLLESVQGLLAVLNEHRQILVVNDTLMTMLGIKESDRLLGLRLGEAIECVHAHEEPGGCQTSKFCSTCGAAIATVVALGTERPAERECAITAEKDGGQVDLYLYVQCVPVFIEGQRFLLLFLRDISVQQQRAALERAFYHDISNVVDALLADSESLAVGEETKAQETVRRIQELASRLAKEVRIQRTLARGPGSYELSIREFSLDRVLHGLQKLCGSHPVARGKTLCLRQTPPDLRISSDAYLLEKVLTNMLTNAFEATEAGGEVRLWVEDSEDAVVISTWNSQQIPEDLGRRVFQRNFSTKEGEGRGLGTYAMKLLGETYLRGKVSFTSSGDGRDSLSILPTQEVL